MWGVYNRCSIFFSKNKKTTCPSYGSYSAIFVYKHSLQVCAGLRVIIYVKHNRLFLMLEILNFKTRILSINFYQQLKVQGNWSWRYKPASEEKYRLDRKVNFIYIQIRQSNFQQNNQTETKNQPTKKYSKKQQSGKSFTDISGKLLALFPLLNLKLCLQELIKLLKVRRINIIPF